MSITAMFRHVLSYTEFTILIETLSPTLVFYLAHIKESPNSKEKTTTSSTHTLINTLVSTLLNTIKRVQQQTQQEHDKFYSTKLLKNLAPLLRVGFEHKCRSMKNTTISFWNETFGKNSSGTLQYPKILVPILNNLKEKAIIRISDDCLKSQVCLLNSHLNDITFFSSLFVILQNNFKGYCHL
jgi:telomere-associated protein RIF1